jgi:hypothetical protein
MFGINKLIPEKSEQKVPRDFPGKAYKLLHNKFYEKTGELLAEITRDNNIDYIVMDKVTADANGAIPRWPVVFENKFYVVITPPHKN